MLIRLSAEQIPRLTQTAKGGKMTAMIPRQMSVPHMMEGVVIWHNLRFVLIRKPS